MSNGIRRILEPVFVFLAVACLVELSLGMTGWFGEDVILWGTLLRAIFTVPGLAYFYREDKAGRGEWRLGIKTAVLLVVAGAGLSVAFRFLFMAIGVPGYEAVEENLMTGNLLLQAVALLAASPILEEFFFRGVLYGRLKELVSVPAAMAVSSALFGLYHGNLSQGIYAFFMGILLAWAMEHCRTVAGPILLHVAANAAAIWLNLVIML
ncbi:MAG: CPBP family intramembrane metalloprotease [Lachnospiraceae bacterium]|nr:CPBP family intramembrane metalloprotease [Lachnospiraceae bacterium]